MIKTIFFRLMFVSIIFGMSTIFLIPGCRFKTNIDDPFKYKPGEKILIVLDNREGIVINCYNHHGLHLYEVRYVTGNVKTDTHFIEEDGPLIFNNYIIGRFYEYELKLKNK